MSLYRKYRPKSFSEIIGQDHVISTLSTAVESDKLAHAYLFAGTRGTGKTSAARILAKAMLTRGMPADDTLTQQIRDAVDEGTIVDLVEIDAASNRGIDDIRDLVEKIQFSPIVGKAKVYIIDEVHMLTREAFNALLKTLEEPPAYAYFILATTELQKIPPTIQSRCQRFQFRQIRDEDLLKGLQHIVDAEHISIDRDALRAIAHHAQGSMRDAISLLDQLRSLPMVTVTDVHERLGESGQDFVEGILHALETGDRQIIVQTVMKLEQTGVPLDVFTRQLLSQVRLRLHASIEQKESIADLSDLLTHLLTALKDIRIAPVPGVALEAALLSITRNKDAGEPEARHGLFRRKKADRDEKPHADAPAAPPPPPKPSPKEEVSATLVEAPEISLESVREHWLHVLQDIPVAWVRMSLKNAHVTAIEGTTLVLSFASAFHRDKIAGDEASHHIEHTLEHVFKRPLRIKCQLEEERTTTPMPQGDMVNLAEAASEVF